MAEDHFRLSPGNTGIRTELTAGVTVFLTMSYIIFLQPAILSGQLFGMDTGLDHGAVITAPALVIVGALMIQGIAGIYWLMYLMAFVLLFYFIFVRAGLD